VGKRLLASLNVSSVTHVVKNVPWLSTLKTPREAEGGKGNGREDCEGG
jgi:hypothetical protein